ncbi:hypothetical protein OKA06_05940 [Novosphingobium sp. MW5]|nr:hypothetical protein [Novosphingobium sp. MW5]
MKVKPHLGGLPDHVRRSLRQANFAAALAFLSAVIRRDWHSLMITLITCSVAAVVTAFQYQVYTSFVRAGAVAPRYVGGAVWVTASSIECFDFPGVIGEDYSGQLARFLPQGSSRRIAFGFAGWTSPTGRRGNVAVIGIDGAAADDTGRVPDGGFVADVSDLARLDLSGEPGQVATLGNETMVLSGTTDRLASFLGAPYVVTTFERARSILRMDPSTTNFIVTGGPEPDRAETPGLLAEASARFPELAILSSTDFAASSSNYWQRKTGAGSAILLAAVLASLLMMILLANGVSRFLQRYSQDLLSMLGHGAGQRDIWLVTGGIAIVVAAVTLLATMLLTPLMIAVARPLFPWVEFVAADALVPSAAVVIALAIAIGSAGKAVRQFGPEAVFRT